MTNEERRKRLDALIADMMATTKAMRARGIEPAQREDREATEIVKRITERAYQPAEEKKA